MNQSASMKSLYRLVMRGAHIICFLVIMSVLCTTTATLTHALGGTFLAFVVALGIVGALTVLSLYALMTWLIVQGSPLSPVGNLVTCDATNTDRRVA